jgi:hypothetical protein
VSRGTRSLQFWRSLFAILIAICCLALQNCARKTSTVIRDEPLIAGRDAGSFTPADEDYFKDMDGGIALTPEEVKGRNMWNVWTGGNDKFWDTISRSSVGTVDFLKTLSSYDPTRDPNAPKDPQQLERLKRQYKFSRSSC